MASDEDPDWGLGILVNVDVAVLPFFSPSRTSAGGL
jgi:hypothetical protein